MCSGIEPEYHNVFNFKTERNLLPRESKTLQQIKRIDQVGLFFSLNTFILFGYYQLLGHRIAYTQDVGCWISQQWESPEW